MNDPRILRERLLLIGQDCESMVDVVIGMIDADARDLLNDSYQAQSFRNRVRRAGFAKIAAIALEIADDDRFWRKLDQYLSARSDADTDAHGSTDTQEPHVA